MTTAVDCLRMEYALAYSENLSPQESNKLQPNESAEHYAERWYGEYGQDVARKIVPVAQKALEELGRNRPFAKVRYDVYCAVFWDGGMEVARVLINRIPQLKYALMTEDDPVAFRERLELIVQAFGTPQS